MVKTLRGSASAPVGAGQEECFALLAALDGYPDWYPNRVRGVDVLERGEDGLPSRAHARLFVSFGPISQELELMLAARTDRPAEVLLTRMANEPSDPERFELRWRIYPGEIALELEATVELPRLVPTSGLGDAAANGFVRAAAGELRQPQTAS